MQDIVEIYSSPAIRVYWALLTILPRTFFALDAGHILSRQLCSPSYIHGRPAKGSGDMVLPTPTPLSSMSTLLSPRYLSHLLLFHARCSMGAPGMGKVPGLPACSSGRQKTSACCGPNARLPPIQELARGREGQHRNQGFCFRVRQAWCLPILCDLTVFLCGSSGSQLSVDRPQGAAATGHHTK